MLGPLSDRFWKFRCGFAQGILQRAKSEQNMRVLQHFQKRWQRGTFEEDLERGITRGRAVQETCSSEMLGGQGANFLRGVAFWSIRSSGLLRWLCVTGAALRLTWHHFCLAGAALYTDGVENRKTHWYVAVSSALNFPWRKSRRIASFLMLSTSKIEDVSQTCFVFDVVKLKKWRTSRRIVSFLTLTSSKIEDASKNCFFLMLSSSKIEEVWQNCFLFKLADCR